MEWRELCAVEIGERICDANSPRRATVRRWLIEDAGFRERYAVALDDYKMSVVEAAIEQADRDVEHMHGRRRVAAMRRQVIARTQWLKLIAAAETARAAANDDSPGERVNKEGRGISDDGIAMLDKAAARFTASISPKADVEEELPPAPEGPEVDFSSRHPREGGDSRVSVPDEKQNVDARGRPGDDELNDNDDEPDYAPEDARYRAKRRDTESQSPQPRPAPEEKKSPWKPDTPTTVRFDDIGGFDVSNQRNEGTGWDSYDPLKG
jgi:hypothetical protein